VRVLRCAEIGHVKRSENVGLVVMGAAAFAATFAGGMALIAWQKPSHAAQSQMAVADQRCTTRSDGTQDCQPQRRGFVYYLVPSFVHGWSSGGSANKPVTREAALVSNSRPGAVSTSHTGVERSGFGSTAKSTSIRVSAGG
jgi:hypothetical protein